jgi:methylthioribose-1-phosphate isomerase
LKDYVEPKLRYLFTARPTAVNLGVATRRLANILQAGLDADKDAKSIARDLVAEGHAIDGEDLSRNKAMSKWGGDWLIDHVKRKGDSGSRLNVMTVCNTGSLATSVSPMLQEWSSYILSLLCQGYGTALGLITYLHETGSLEKAYFTQSTPYHQGSRCV